MTRKDVGELTRLKDGITNFSDAAENCDIIKTNFQSEIIGDAIRALDYGRKPLEEIDLKEYKSLYREYNKAKEKLWKCDCKRIK